MTAITATESSTSATSAPEATTTSRAVAVRRGLIIAAPILAAGFGFMGALGDPAAGHNGAEMVKTYIENPTPLQWKSTGYHWAYAFWMLPAFLGAALVKGKGAWLANVAALLAFAGMVTLPGMLITDWYASAIGHEFGYAGTHAVETYMEDTMWGVIGFGIASMAGFIIGVPLSVVALMRARLVRWWTLPAVVVPLVALFVSQGAVWSAAVCAVCLAAYAVALRGAVRKA
jgi:hypothetical protein